MDALPMQFETTGDYGGARESHGFLTGTEYTFSPFSARLRNSKLSTSSYHYTIYIRSTWYSSYNTIGVVSRALKSAL